MLGAWARRPSRAGTQHDDSDDSVAAAPPSDDLVAPAAALYRPFPRAAAGPRWYRDCTRVRGAPEKWIRPLSAGRRSMHRRYERGLLGVVGTSPAPLSSSRTDRVRPARGSP